MEGQGEGYVRDDRPFCGDAAPAAACFYSPDRGGAHPAAHMAGFTGCLQADGYAGFEALYDAARSKPGPIVEVAWWARLPKVPCAQRMEWQARGIADAR